MVMLQLLREGIQREKEKIYRNGQKDIDNEKKFDVKYKRDRKGEKAKKRKCEKVKR